MLQPPLATLRPGNAGIVILDQTVLPHAERQLELHTLADAARAIRTMQVRGAPLIGGTAAWGVALAMTTDASDAALEQACATLAATRPTAVNLHWALRRMQARLTALPAAARAGTARAEAAAVCAEDAAACAAIGAHGLPLLARIAAARPGPVRVMTHCNAGWLATLGIGTALAPVYAAHAAGIPVEVWVSETRPRNQGLLTAWELARWGVPHRLIVDNAAGHCLARGMVDLVITGADRIAANGDTANKIGTCLKALAAQAAGVPFYIAAPRSTFDAACPDGGGIPIEERDGEEVRLVHGLATDGHPASCRLLPADEDVANPAFDLTPAALIAGYLTEDACFAATDLAPWLARPARPAILSQEAQ